MPPVEIDVTEIQPLKPRVIPPRAVGDLLPAQKPFKTPPKKVVIPTVAELLAKMDPPFDPLKELVDLYRTGFETVVDKEGNVHEIPLEATVRASILKELLAHVHVKPKPTERKDEGERGAQNINIITYGDVHMTNGELNNASSRLGSAKLPAPSVEILREEAAQGESGVPVAPTGG